MNKDACLTISKARKNVWLDFLFCLRKKVQSRHTNGAFMLYVELVRQPQPGPQPPCDTLTRAAVRLEPRFRGGLTLQPSV